MDFNNFKGTARRLDDIDLPKMGALIGVGEDELHAVIDIESRGDGFDDDGRPVILFERHKFYEYCPKEKLQRAIKAGLASKTPGGYGKYADQYPKFLKAYAIDPRAAIMSCSWGMFQIMGFNYKLAGFDNPEDMVLAMMEDEEVHLAAAINFIINAGLDDELRAHNWEGFARGYNGKQFKKNNYDTRLAESFRKWSRIKDTPWSPDLIEQEPQPEPQPPVTHEPTPQPVQKSWLRRLWEYFFGE